MGTYGYDSWHQTTVGRTETAQRPLRLNETVALAGLFGVPVTRLLTPLPMRIEAIDEEIRLTEDFRERARPEAERAEADLQAAYTARKAAMERHETLSRTIEWADTHIEVLHGLRDIIEGKPVEPGFAEQLADPDVLWNHG